jgi:hypothetical protein
VVIGILFLKETHPIKKHERDRGVEIGHRLVSLIPWLRSPPSSCDAAEKQPLLGGMDSLPAYASVDSCTGLSSSEAQDGNDAVFLRDASMDTSIKAEIDGSVNRQTFNRNVVLNIVSYGILAL